MVKLLGSMPAFLFLIGTMVVGCNKAMDNQGSQGKQSGMPAGFPGSIPDSHGKSSPSKQIMVKLAKGPQSLTTVIGAELKSAVPPWDKLEPQSKEFVQLAGSMASHEPPKGSKESWLKLTSAYTESAVALEKAVKEKNKDTASAAHQVLAKSCMACHKAHRGKGGFGPPGGFEKFGPPGKFGPGGSKGPGGPPPD